MLKTEKALLAVILVAFSFASKAQVESLQTVTDRGNVTTNALISTSQEGFSNHKITDKTILSSYKSSVRNWQIDDVEGQFRLYMDGNYNGYNFNVLPNGNVGIGTTNPQTKLDVYGQLKSFNVGFGQIDAITSSKNYANFSSNIHGSVLISSNLYFQSNGELKVVNSHPSMSGASILIPGNSQANQNAILFYTNMPAVVEQDQVYTGAVSMAINSNGNVGVGTTTPQEKLSVNGNIRAKEIKVETSNWPDYVFEKDYKITSLSDLEKYIEINKHLPDMPSAKEIENEGLELGEIVKKQQKIIEELTLFLINQNKVSMQQSNQLTNQQVQLQSQQQEINKLKKKTK